MAKMPDFMATRNEIAERIKAQLVGSDWDGVSVVSYRPVNLGGRSPYVGVWMAGFRPLLMEADFGNVNVGYQVGIFINRELHGAAAAADIHDTFLQWVGDVLIDREWNATSFDAVQVAPGGGVAPTFLEILDGKQHTVTEIPLVALNVRC